MVWIGVVVVIQVNYRFVLHTVLETHMVLETVYEVLCALFFYI